MYHQTSSSDTGSYAAQPVQARSAREIAFIDTALDDCAILAAALRAGVEAVEFGGARDGLAQLALWAHGEAGYDAIHVLCHGEPGRLILGGRVLDAGALDTPEAAAALGALGAALNPGGALLLYGCSVGAGDVGQRFVARLAQAVGATVAASEVPTGAAARGGDWALPVRSGPVPVPLALEAKGAAAWPHLMAGVRFDLSTGTWDENVDLYGPVTETVSGLTMSAIANDISNQSFNDIYVWDTRQYLDFTPTVPWSYVSPSNNNVVIVSQQGTTTSASVTFSQAVTLDSLDFADAYTNGAKLRITATNTSDTTVIDLVPGGDLRVTLHWVGVTGVTITNELGQVLDPLLIDNIVVTPGSVPTTTVASASLSADTGASSTDFVTKTAAQTISGTLSGLLASGETVQISYDNGAHWQNADTYAVGSSAWSATTTLAGSSTLQVRVANVYGNSTAYTHSYTVDTTAPNAPSAPDLASGSDSGASNSDNITVNTTPTITGTTESGSTVTLYDTDGTTVLGTTTATGGSWSIASGTLGQGGHTLTAKATDLAGNVSAASTGLAVTIDTTAPASVALSASTVVTANAGSGASVGTLSATDATAVTYALAAGNGTNDADNGQFTVAGNTLKVGGSALTAGTYHVYLAATDAAGNVSHLAQTITVQSVPTVSSIVRAGGAGAGVAGSAASVDYTVTFSESVTGVDASDFGLTATGTASGTIAAVSGSGTTYTVTVNSLTGDGTLRLDLNNSGTGIQNGSSVAIGGGYTAGATYTLDHTAPNAPSTPDLTSDSGASSSDDITAAATPVITGTAESGSTVTLYDSDGTTVLGTTTATGGAWSITASTLSDGGHTLTAKAADAAGNVSNASSSLAVTIDTAAPAGVVLSASSLVTANAGSGASVGTLSATDATAVTYALAAGNGTNDADNGQFAVSGNTLSIGGSALTAGTYHVYLSATDAAGNVSYLAQNILVQNAPTVSSIVRVGGAGVAGSATSVDYTVTFSESVTGVDASDFALTATGTASGHIAAVNGSGSTYTVTVDSLAGDGTLRLDLNASGTGILNGSSVAIGGGYTAGATYTLDHTAPNAPSTPDLSSVSDSGNSSSDDITAVATPVITGTAESGSTVTLYDTNGTTVLGTTTATGGLWSITASTLADGAHTLTAKATDAAGNVSNASSSLAVTIDTTAPAGVALSASSLVTANAGSGAAVGTLSASDATAVTYALATGNGSNDADNAKFALSGNTLAIGGSALTAGTYHVYLAATDAAGNVSHVAQTILVQDAPTVSSIARVGGAGVPGAATSIDYTVTFSESVTGVDASDFALTATGTASGHIAAVNGSGSTYTITVDSLAGDGTLRLDLNASGTGILNGNSVAIGGGYTAGATYTLDHTAPNAPSTPDLTSDSGTSSSDDITAVATPVITGTAESGSTVTLYDTNGTTVLGTTTATGGLWSITASTLADGAHTLTAKATDAAGNVSNASSSLAVTIDTTAPAGVALSASSLVTANAGSGAAVGTLSASDATAVTYALATGNGSNDADNAKFALSGNALSIGGSALTAGTYHVYLAATDAAGNVSHVAQTILVQDAPTVSSIARVGGAGVPGAATSVDYAVTFSESVTGVDASDFALTATGTASGHIAAVNGRGSTYTITVDSLAGDGTLRLDLNNTGTGILNGNSVAIGGGYTAGATYTLDHTAPNAPSTPDLISDSGASSSDDITAVATPVITGTAESGSTVTLYDTNGTTVLGTTTATGGLWSISASTLADGAHTLTAKATDAAGNVSNASSSLAVTIDTTAPTSVALSATNMVTTNAVGGASVGTLSASDATAVTYALATGNGSNDADNAKFALSGNTLAIGGSALTAGTYHVYLAATDAAGNVSHVAQTILVQDAPTVSSIARVGGAGVAGAATSIDYTVTFSESVTGVDASDFALTATGTASGHIAAVNGSGSTYTVTVDSLAGDGTLRLDLNASGTGIQNGNSVAIGGGYTAGATYTLDHTAPNAPSTPDLTSDSGSSSSDDITAAATPVITGTAESGSTVTLYDTNGTTVLGTTTATNGSWSITASTLADGSHTLTAKAADAAGNVSNASSGLTITIDTAAAAPGAIAFAAAADSGAVGDGITNINTPTITGTAEANATVTLYDTDGTTQLGTTTADGTGAWQIVPAVLADGSHTLTARQVDLAGNASAASAGLTVTIDTQAPAAPDAPTLDAASDSGTAGDGITTVTRPVIRGTGAANAVVTLYDTDGTTPLGTATADGAGNWSVTSATLSVGAHTLTAKQADAAGNVSAAGAALALTIAAPPPPPPPPTSTIDGVVVSAQPVVLPGGGSGTQTVVPIVTPGRVESTGAAAVADIPLVQSGGANLLLAQVPVGFGLSATGGASRPAGDPLEHLIQAIVAATPDHAPADQAHLTGNGKQFLQALAADAPLLVQTITPVSNGTAPAGQLVLSGTSDDAQHTALVIDATQLAAGSGIALNGVDFAAVVGAANVTGTTAGQVLTGDAAAQTFTVAGNLGGAVFAGGGGDRLAFGVTPATPSSADGGARAAAAPVETILHGGLGTDTAVFDGARSAYTVEQHEGYLVVTPTAQPAQHAVVVNVESLQFADATEAVVNRADLSSIAGLYQTILGRQADYLGMDFWGSAAAHGVGLGEVALRMIASQEGQGRLAGAFDGNAAHDVALLYQDLFGRAGEAAGLAFWTDAMVHGATLAQVAQGFATSAEFEQHKVGVAQWDFFV